MTGVRRARWLRLRIRLGLLLALLLIVTGVAMTAAVRYLRVDEIRLPDLHGMTYSEAAEMLRDLDLEPVSYPDNVPGMAVEVVTSQTPPAGSVVRQGRNVSIGVNRPPEAARAPVLLGLHVDQALNTADDVNLRLESVRYAHSSHPAGRVIEQHPEPGAAVPVGEGMAIVVSRGPDLPQVTMPDLVGLPAERARRQLLEMGLRSVQLVAAGVSFEAPGAVASQDPAAGTEVPVGTPVLLNYRLSAREVVPVPAVVGQEPRLAERMLRAAGLELGEVLYVDESEQPRGTVAAVSPSSYTLRGSPVTLTLNAPQGSYEDLERGGSFDFRFGEGDDDLGRGVDDDFGRASDDGFDDLAGLAAEGERIDREADILASGRRVSVTFDPATLGVRSLMERDYDLRVVVEDDGGERTVIDRRVAAGEAVSAVIVVEGDALLQTYINDVFFQAWRP